MGGSFFAPLQRLASHDPLAGALNLPGSHTYAQQQNARVMGGMYSTAPYQGVTPTLAGANAGYTAGGPGSIPGTAPLPAQNAFSMAARGATQQQPTNFGGRPYG